MSATGLVAPDPVRPTRTVGDRLVALGSQLVPHAILLFACFLAIAPFVWSFFGSFKPFKELISSADLFPRTWTIANYSEILNRAHFLEAFRNSVIVSGAVTLASLFTSSTLGYIFAKYSFRGKELLFGAILATMMVPFVVLLVPLYLTMAQIGLVDKLGGVIIVGLWSSLGVFMMRQFIEGVPSELIDAARIDGASEWLVYRRIILPLVKAPLAALAILVFLNSWDSFLWPSAILHDASQQTVPLLLYGLRSLYWSRYDLWSAGSMLTVVPVMIVYVIGSKYFIRGFAMTGLKG
jgi:multiple sugar transport system permease protein